LGKKSKRIVAATIVKVGNDIRRQLNKYGELGKDEKDEGRDGGTIFDDH
jgi:hypothetical protein